MKIEVVALSGKTKFDNMYLVDTPSTRYLVVADNPAEALQLCDAPDGAQVFDYGFGLPSGSTPKGVYAVLD